MRSGEESLTSFNNNNRANFPVKKVQQSFPESLFFADYSKK